MRISSHGFVLHQSALDFVVMCPCLSFIASFAPVLLNVCSSTPSTYTDPLGRSPCVPAPVALCLEHDLAHSSVSFCEYRAYLPCLSTLLI